MGCCRACHSGRCAASNGCCGRSGDTKELDPVKLEQGASGAKLQQKLVWPARTSLGPGGGDKPAPTRPPGPPRRGTWGGDVLRAGGGKAALVAASGKLEPAGAAVCRSQARAFTSDVSCHGKASLRAGARGTRAGDGDLVTSRPRGGVREPWVGLVCTWRGGGLVHRLGAGLVDRAAPRPSGADGFIPGADNIREAAHPPNVALPTP